MFDLNEVDSVDIIDIEFLFYSCLSSAYKIYNITEENQDIMSDSVNEFVIKILKLKENQRYTVINLIEYIIIF